LAIDRWSCAAGLPTSSRSICLTIAPSQSLALAEALIWATASSRVPWIQSFSWADQTLPSSGSLSGLKAAGRRSVSLGGTTTMPVPSIVSHGLTFL